MKTTLTEEVVKVVKKSEVTIQMSEDEAHMLLEQLGYEGIPDNSNPKTMLYKLWQGLNSEIGQR